MPPATSDRHGCSVAARHGQQPDQRRDLLAETTRRDQHDALGAVGELVRELHRDAAAEAVTDDRDLVDAQDRQQVPHAVGVAAQRVVGVGLVGLAVPQQVGRDDREALRQRRDDVLPGRGVAGQAVQQQKRGARAADAVRPPVAVHDHVPDVLGTLHPHILGAR
jgi:hypothetical protein